MKSKKKIERSKILMQQKKKDSLKNFKIKILNRFLI